jgi:F0F1-type ATP synthase assembly protein I
MKFLYKPKFTTADLLVLYVGMLIDKYIIHSGLFMSLFYCIGFIIIQRQKDKNYHEALPRNTNNE